MKNSFLGKHLIVDAYGIEEKRLKDRRAVVNLLKSLPGKFNMRLLGNVVVKKVASDSHPNWGLSGFVMLYESHISFHTWPEKGYVAMDIYSCNDFDHEAVKKHLREFWKTKKMKAKTVIRG